MQLVIVRYLSAVITYDHDLLSNDRPSKSIAAWNNDYIVM